MNIKQTIDNELCHGCGTCVGLCPISAIEMKKNDTLGVYVPQLNNDKCNDCELCYKVCPGYSVDFKNLSGSFLNSLHNNVFLGSYRNCYTGYTQDNHIRYNSASGGLVTSILLWLLEKRVIDGAVVTKMDEKRPLEPRAFIARSPNEIISAARSKYCPVPLNVTLKEVIEADGKFAVVGIPCQLHGIRKAQSINKRLNEKIIVSLGVFCGMAWNFLATEMLIQKMGIVKEDIQKLDYRGGGWPGRLLITLKDGKTKKLSYPYPLHQYDADFKVTTPARCILCSDASSELADISFGDADLSDFKDDKTGRSIVIVRSLLGEHLLKTMEAEKVICLTKTNSEKIIQGKKNLLCRKKKTLRAHFSFYKLVNSEIPAYNQELLKPQVQDYLRALFLYMRTYISKNKKLKSLMKLYPSFRSIRKRLM